MQGAGKRLVHRSRGPCGRASCLWGRIRVSSLTNGGDGSACFRWSEGWDSPFWLGGLGGYAGVWWVAPAVVLARSRLAPLLQIAHVGAARAATALPRWPALHTYRA
ncbi:hypothetical protein GLE_4770 [Lysobacter enzymogenes]|uniref:Uncharacterized protein n=1 Tax=Lysobacter enzymogenes TaxID=69 RepID=A0A0S2DP80_LYSEN|nr:hypothetical protein GLE_4770 [Lysobacter enzymogenes]